MKKPYERVTPIGYNTGKVTIGGHYLPKPQYMSLDACRIQAGLLYKGKPRSDGLLAIIVAQIKSKWRLIK